MRPVVLALALVACGTPGASSVDVDAAPPDITPPDAPASGVPLAGFGEISGMCGVLAATDFTAPAPELIRDTITFARAYVDPTDRPLLTTGGVHLAETPNAGGSSGLSEVFAYEQLARCELADLLKTETEIVYDVTGKITDLEVSIDGHKVGVSVTRAVAYPFGDPYTLETATTLITRKLSDIQLSTANVSQEDRWDKQILSVLAWDDTAANTVFQAWTNIDAATKANTIVIVTTTSGEDLFIYSDQ